MRKLIIALSALFTALWLHSAHAQTGGGTAPAIPPPKVCSTACTVTLKVGQSVILIKGSATQRSNTTTQTADPDMQLTCSNCNFVKLSGQVNYFTPTPAQGIRMQLMASSTCVSVAGPSFAIGELTSTTTSIQDWASNNFLNTSGSSSSQENFVLDSTNTNTSIFLCWAQAVSGAALTAISANTTFIMTRVN